jgi:glyoxylase-like metal-dependent hydrolase (beta-lactamase superfamily II)
MRSLLRYLAVLFTAVACRPASQGDASAGGVVRTANSVARGLTEADFPRVQRLADAVYTYEALRSAGDERFTTVSMFVVTSDGVLVADGQGSPEETTRLVNAIARITDRPVTHVVICSDHGDHTAGNVAFPREAAFLAHPTSAAILAATSAQPHRAADAPPVVLPTELVETERVLRLGGREIRVLFLGRAHTGGDLVVYLPREKILFMSETFLNRVFPAMRSAYPSEWIAMIRKAQTMDVDVYVPGHGFVDPPAVLREELETYRRALEQVIAEGRRLHAAGLSAEQAVTQARFGELETWSLRQSQGARAIQRVYMELNGELPP